MYVCIIIASSPPPIIITNHHHQSHSKTHKTQQDTNTLCSPQTYSCGATNRGMLSYICDFYKYKKTMSFRLTFASSFRPFRSFRSFFLLNCATTTYTYTHTHTYTYTYTYTHIHSFIRKKYTSRTGGCSHTFILTHSLILTLTDTHSHSHSHL
jgi:hypothetical protein